MKTIKPETIEEAIDFLQQFLECDLYTKLKPEMDIDGSNFIRDDYIKDENEFLEYMNSLFNILREDIKELKNGVEENKYYAIQCSECLRYLGISKTKQIQEVFCTNCAKELMIQTETNNSTAQYNTDNNKDTNLREKSTAQHNSHQEGIRIRTEVVSQETDLGVTPRPDDTNSQKSRKAAYVDNLGNVSEDSDIRNKVRLKPHLSSSDTTQHIKSRGKDKDESLSDVANVESVDKYSGIAEHKQLPKSDVIVKTVSDVGKGALPSAVYQQVLQKNNSNSMSDATSTGNNDSDEVGCSEDLSQPADSNIRNKYGRSYTHNNDLNKSQKYIRGWGNKYE